MALSRHVWQSALCASTLLGLATSGAYAADEVDNPPPYVYQEVRLGIVGAPAPSVRQDGKNWSGGDSRGYRFGVTYLRGTAPFNDYTGTVWGLQGSIGTYNVETADSPATGEDLTQGMVDLYYGIQYGIVQTQSLRGFAELLPFVGVGFSDINVVDGGEYKAGLGGAYEMGLRTGVYLTERQWLGGITAGYTYGQSQVSGDQTIELKTNGFFFGGEFGYRF